MERQLALQEQQTATMGEQVRQQRRENPNYKPASIFIDPDSGKEYRELLERDIFFGPIRMNRTPLTKCEVEVLNKLRPVEKAVIEKTDGSEVRVTVRAREDAVGRIERLTVELPLKKDDNPMHYPAIVDMGKDGSSRRTGRGWAEQLVAQIKDVVAA